MRDRSLAVVAATPLTVSTFLLPLLVRLKNADYDVFVISSGDNERALRRIADAGIDVEIVPLFRGGSLWEDLNGLVAIFKVLKRRRPCIVHSHTPKASFVTQIVSWVLGIKVRFVTIHGLYFVNRVGVGRVIYRWLELVSCYLATFRICVSDEDARYLVEEWGFSSAKLLSQPVGVDLERFNATSIAAEFREPLRRSIGADEQTIIVGTVCRLVKEKGVLDLFEAVKMLRAKNIDAMLVHVGGREKAETDCRLVGDESIFEAYDWCYSVGEVESVEGYLAAFDVFCLASHREGFPVSVMEAMAMAVPCVVTDIRGCREAVADRETGFVVTPRSPSDLVLAIEKLLFERGLMNRISLRCRQEAEDRFDRVTLDQRIVDLYESEVSFE